MIAVVVAAVVVAVVVVVVVVAVVVVVVAAVAFVEDILTLLDHLIVRYHNNFHLN